MKEQVFQAYLLPLIELERIIFNIMIPASNYQIDRNKSQVVVWRQSQQWAKEALEATIAGVQVQGARPLRQTTTTGAWLMVHRSTVNGMELVEHEWRDFLFLWYGLENPRPSQIL